MVLISTFFLLIAIAQFARGAEIALVPVSADGAHVVNGAEIVLTGGGQRVFFDVRLSDWNTDGGDSPALQGFQITVDPSGYENASLHALTAANESCTTDSECSLAFGAGSTCSFPDTDPTHCTPAFIDVSRPDYVFASISHFPAVDLSTSSFRFAGASLLGGAIDSGLQRYAGTLVLDVPVGALGTYVIGLKGTPESTLQDEDLNSIEPLTRVSASIAIACSSGGDCDDGNECTVDSCLESGTCLIQHGFDASRFCCDPVNGTLLEIDDANECTNDSCDPATGSVGHDVRQGAACGDDTQTDCDDPDTCDQDGVCQPNLRLDDPSCSDDGAGLPPGPTDSDGDEDGTHDAGDATPEDSGASDDSVDDGDGSPSDTPGFPDDSDLDGVSDSADPSSGTVPITRRGPCGIAMVQSSVLIFLGLSAIGLMRRRAETGHLL